MTRTAPCSARHSARRSVRGSVRRAVRRAAPGGALAAMLVASLLSAQLLARAAPARSHDIPAEATVEVLAKPGDGKLRLLVRAPLAAMRDIEFPLRGPGYLDLAQLGPELRTAARTWIVAYVRVFEEGEPLEAAHLVTTRVSLPADRSFATSGTWEDALAHVTGPPLPAGTDLVWEQASLDVLVEIPVTSPASRFSIESGLAHLAMETRTVLRYFDADGSERVLRFTGDPGRIRLDPRWHDTALRYLEAGLTGLLGGVEHVLFVLALVIPFRKSRELAPVIVAVAAGSVITLVGGGLGLAPDGLWFPPLVATVVAVSVLYAAVENVVGARPGRRWPAAFAFGLAHGFALSFPLMDRLQFAGDHETTALLAFTGGVELALMLLALAGAGVFRLAFRRRVPERIGVILVSALIAHEAWHWTRDRWDELAGYRIPAPSLEPAFLAAAMRWAMVLLALFGVGWLLSELFQRWGLVDRPEDPLSGDAVPTAERAEAEPAGVEAAGAGSTEREQG